MEKQEFVAVSAGLINDIKTKMKELQDLAQENNTPVSFEMDRVEYSINRRGNIATYNEEWDSSNC